MSSIANQWTGNGLTDGTVVASGNVNTSGNGSTVTFNTSGTATIVTEANGFRVKDAASTGIRRLDAAVSGNALRMQMKLTVGEYPTSAAATIISVRDSSTSKALLYIDTAGSAYMTAGSVISASATPSIAVGSTVIVDLVVALHSSPTTSNGRLFIRVKNLTNTSWATSGEFFYDSGYTLNLGTAAFASIRYGKMSTEILGSTGFLYEYPGWEVITVNTADTSTAASKAYFADAPVDLTPLSTPVVTVSSFTNPSSAGASTGTITVTWPPVASAHHYEAAIADGDVTSGYSVVSTTATSPYTFTNVSAGQKTVTIRAKASE